MSKSPDAFRTISEVADWLGVQAHVLRFWESRFTQVKPVKRAGGRRYYRPADMQLLGGIRKLLHDDGLTIKGVQKMLREQGIAEISALSHPLDEPIPPGPEDPVAPPDPATTGAAEPAGELLSFRRATTGEAAPENPVAGHGEKTIATGESPDTADPVLDRPVPRAPGPIPTATEPSQTAAVSAETAPKPDTGEKPEPATASGQLPSFLKPTDDETSGIDARQETPSAPAPDPVQDAASTSADVHAEPSATPAAKPHLPEPPIDENALPYVPGLLAILAGVDGVDPQTRANLGPIMNDLKACLSRIGGSDLA